MSSRTMYSSVSSRLLPKLFTMMLWLVLSSVPIFHQSSSYGFLQEAAATHDSTIDENDNDNSGHNNGITNDGQFVPVLLQIDHHSSMNLMSFEDKYLQPPPAQPAIYWEIVLAQDDELEEYTKQQQQHEDQRRGNNRVLSSRRRKRIIASSNQFIGESSYDDHYNHHNSNNYSTFYNLKLPPNQRYWFIAFDKDGKDRFLNQRTKTRHIITMNENEEKRGQARTDFHQHYRILQNDVVLLTTENSRIAEQSDKQPRAHRILFATLPSSVSSPKEGYLQDIETAEPVPLGGPPLSPGQSPPAGISGVPAPIALLEDRYLQDRPDRPEDENEENNVPGGPSPTDPNPGIPNPTPPLGTKPPVEDFPTSAPFVAVPSPSPTAELPCVSTGMVMYDRAYLAVRLQLTEGASQDGISNDDIMMIGAAMTTAYNDIALCEQVGAFRITTDTTLQRKYIPGTSEDIIEVVFAMQGRCEGCSDENFRLFTIEDSFSDETFGGGRRELQHGETIEEEEDGGGRRKDDSGSFFQDHMFMTEHDRDLSQTTCFCRGPSAVAFVDSFNRDQASFPSFPSSIRFMLEAVELFPDDGRCQVFDPDIIDEEMVVESHISQVVVRVSEDPSEWEDNEIEDFVQAFEDTYRLEMGLARGIGVCDISRRTISNVELELGEFFTSPVENRRNLRSSSFALDHSRYLQTGALSETYEILLSVEYNCQGCDGHLFGEEARGSMVLDQLDCLCPSGFTRGGITEQQFQVALAAAVEDRLPFFMTVSEVTEAEEIPCGELGGFTAFTILEIDVTAFDFRPLKVLAQQTTSPILTDIERSIIEEAFIISFNSVSRQFCDPLQRQLVSATISNITEVAAQASIRRLSLAISVIGVCRGDGCGLEEGTPLFDGETALVDFDLFGDNTDAEDNIGGRALSISAMQAPDLLQRGAPHLFHSPPLYRKLQSDAGDTCYCGVNAVQDQGPNEPSVVGYFGDLLSPLVNTTLAPNIVSVVDCQFLTFFRASILLDISLADNDSEVDVDAISQTVMNRINNANVDGTNSCDRQSRQITNARAGIINVTDRENITGSDEVIASPDGRRILSKTKILRRTQSGSNGDGSEDSSSSNPPTPPTTSTPIPGPTTVDLTFEPSFEPSTRLTISPDLDSTASPTTAFAVNSVSVLVLLGGVCRGCGGDFLLSNQVTDGGRNLQEQDQDDEAGEMPSQDLEAITVEGACFCPPDSEPIQPTQEEIAEALGELAFVDQAELEEVMLLGCTVETNEFETSIRIDFFAEADGIDDADLQFVFNLWQTTYNRLSEEFCDELFRRSERVVSIKHDQISSADEEGVSIVRFDMVIVGTCIDCDDGTRFLSVEEDDRRLRQLEEEELCFCERGQKRGIPTEEEYVAALVEAFEETSRRKQRERGLQSEHIKAFSNFGNQEVTDSPTEAPRPRGIENFPACIFVARPQFIGDGWCDSEIADGYNTPECGYDGGDCCCSSCVDNVHECGLGGFDCLDPARANDACEEETLVGSAPTGLEACFRELVAQVENPGWVGNGFCDRTSVYNTELCNWDNGDCCEDSCTNLDGTTPCNTIFVCRDPLVSSCSGDSVALGDGICDTSNNNAGCDFDAGDCCLGSCLGACEGISSDTCEDPDFQCDAPIPGFLGDGICDGPLFNNANCDFDNGDCCEDTCEGDQCGVFEFCEGDQCNGFFCVADGSCTYDLPSDCNAPIPEYIGDGWCDDDPEFNNEECEWDGGDCCPETCPRDEILDCHLYACAVFAPYACLDPVHVSSSPSSAPSGSPSESPSTAPSESPSESPSSSPSNSPSSSPSESPSTAPSESPSTAPSESPSTSPSLSPSTSPSESPSTTPSESPSTAPSESPSTSPSLSPSTSPSTAPSESPSTSPSLSPSISPSTAPSESPSTSPSLSPSSSPSISPSDSPSSSPSENPSTTPSLSPSTGPSSSPSSSPSTAPSRTPSSQPSSIPSSTPSSIPSSTPSSEPSSSPSLSGAPSSRPSRGPSLSVEPSSQPSPLPSLSIAPSSQPSKEPSGSIEPSLLPSSSPSLSLEPSLQPTGSPSNSIAPSLTPTSMPSFVPSLSSKPSSNPSSSPSTSNPSLSIFPSNEPSFVPSTSIQPSSNPTSVSENCGSDTPAPGTDRLGCGGSGKNPFLICTNPTNNEHECTNNNDQGGLCGCCPGLVYDFNNDNCNAAPFDANDCCVPPPTSEPSDQPSMSLSPSLLPSSSISPSLMPSASPSTTVSPSFGPTVTPSNPPSFGPTSTPTSLPTGSTSPSYLPSLSSEPTNTVSPSFSPSLSVEPSLNPSAVPSSGPSLSAQPSAVPTGPPSMSMIPSSYPSKLPSTFPSQFPSAFPSYMPSSSIGPSASPSNGPSSSIGPSAPPSNGPSSSILPSTQPSLITPSPSSSTSPSAAPSLITPAPSASIDPSSQPSLITPSPSSSMTPSSIPSSYPSQLPSTFPSEFPSTPLPTIGPTASPTQAPTSGPTSPPTSNPTAPPSSSSTSAPTNHPTVPPTSSPTFAPTNDPTTAPTSLPTSPPTGTPPARRNIRRQLLSFQERHDDSKGSSSALSSPLWLFDDDVSSTSSLRTSNDNNQNNRIIFISSSDIQGNEIGGSKTADSICHNLALSAGFDGQFVAWMVSNNDEPHKNHEEEYSVGDDFPSIILSSNKIRIWEDDDEEDEKDKKEALSSYFYFVLVDGTKIAKIADDFNKSKHDAHNKVPFIDFHLLMNKINKDEYGNYKYGPVWTHVMGGGGDASTSSCGSSRATASMINNFDKDGITTDDGIMKTSGPSFSWTVHRPCNERYPIYCFQK